ncbi:MAG: efflux RND transporter periplasmic adaptor subunit [Chromatiales bacterium]|nr:MAG: efflux RND transporter periplasmic adaptor subunit [Chromatiales bacterium]
MSRPCAFTTGLGRATGVALLVIGATATAQSRAIRVTTAQPARATIEETEWSVGLIETRTSSQIAAEVAGEVMQVFVDEGQGVAAGAVLAEIDPSAYQLERIREQSEVRRLSALLRKQERELERARKLYEENLIAEDELDGLDAELDALREQLAGARAQVDSTDRRLGKTRLVAPVESEVATRNVDVGDYVQTGTVAFDLIDMRNLRVRLPFPEYRAPQLASGLPVRLTSAAAGDSVVEAVVTDIRPSVNPSSRSLTIIVDFENPGGWRPGASVRADLILAVRENALLVPQVSVVRRPAGDVVYAIRDGIASQRVVQRGDRRDRMVEIVSGLTGDEEIAVDGAGFLSDGAAVDVAEE